MAGVVAQRSVWDRVRRAGWLLVLAAGGVALTGYFVVNGARPPVDPLSWASWVAWWTADPRSALSLIVSSGFGVFGAAAS
ncbi:MAG: hypothetical protein H7243_06125, partial [Sphingomonadaceae bacterium]|nr:hypothetical protein [Sphingomonadaceae bacterium]